jgi:hypothetical protein
MSEVSPHRDAGVRSYLNRRNIQIALGVIWILDAALQFQPRMFTSAFPSQVLMPTAQGQPGWLAAAITHMANFVSHDVALWNTVFALTQLAIGVGLLFPRTVKRALGLSIVWSVAVWVLGEGMGQIFTGRADPLMGAPGAVLLYALIAVLVWPTNPRPQDEGRTGAASSAAGQGPLGATGGLITWAVLWTFFAILLLLPDNRGANSLHNMLAGMTAGEPGWFAHFLSSTAHAFVNAGTWTAVILAGLCLVIGIGPLLSRRYEPYLYVGMALAVIFWITGEALGGILTGLGTDPNSGPLLVLLALALLPAVPEVAPAPAPLARLLARQPRYAIGALAGLVILPVAVAAIPIQSGAVTASAAAPGATLASGASGSSGSSAGGSSTAGMNMAGMNMASGAKHASTKMNMAGMAGLGITDPSWHYTGPPLPAAEVSLLTASSDAQDQGHSMQTPNCSNPPTANQMLGATQYVQAVSSAVAKYKVLSVAVAAGYRPITNPAYPVVHYLNLSYMQPQYIMDPNHVDSLVYAFTPDGPVLVAAMFLLPSVDAKGPMPYGCLVQWHAHTNLCYSSVTHTIVGFTPCPAGQYNARTPEMTHVWQVPVSGGPLAIDPSDLEVMEAAIQSQQQGLSPVTPPGGSPTYRVASATVGTF